MQGDTHHSDAERRSEPSLAPILFALLSIWGTFSLLAGFTSPSAEVIDPWFLHLVYNGLQGKALLSILLSVFLYFVFRFAFPYQLTAPSWAVPRSDFGRFTFDDGESRRVRPSASRESARSSKGDSSVTGRSGRWQNFFQTPSCHVAMGILAVIFSLMMVVGRAFNVDVIGYGVYGSFSTLVGDPSRTVYSLLIFFGLIPTMYVCLVSLVRLIEQLVDRPFTLWRSSNPLTAAIVGYLNDPKLGPTMIIFIIAWSPYLIAFFPGAIYIDGASQYLGYYEPSELTGHHPLLTTFIMGWLMDFARLFGSDTLGVLLYVALQTLLLAYALARTVRFAVRFFPTGRLWIALIAVLFFALVPIFPNTVVSVKKDALFYACFTLMFLKALEIAFFLPRDRAPLDGSENSYRWWCYISLFLWGCAVALIRNDGMIFAIALLICLAIYQGKRHGREITACLVSALLVFCVYQIGYKTLVLGAFNIPAGSISEALSIPLSQTARYYIEYNDEITPEEEQGLSRVLNTQGLVPDVYFPRTSDNIKFGFFLPDVDNDDLLAYAQVYLGQGFKHPDAYAAAFIDLTCGWWYPEIYGDPDHTVSGMMIYQNTPADGVYGKVIDITMPFYEGFTKPIFRRIIDGFSYIPGIGLLTYPAIYCWMMLFAIALLLALSPRERRVLWFFLPLALYYLVCIASPANGLTRYAVPIIICLVVAIPLAFRMFRQFLSAQSEIFADPVALRDNDFETANESDRMGDSAWVSTKAESRRVFRSATRENSKAAPCRTASETRKKPTRRR